ncbi:MAG: phage tail protein I [Rhizobiales bacterium]|nr:phage tail protein I [Hyphomicrobiales bacterium]
MAREVLLPPNRTAFEAAADLTGAQIDEIPVDLPKLVRPYEIPAPHLPWLAWGLSVDLWDATWPEDKRRVLTARALPMHARKGTAASIAEHIRIMGAEPRGFIVPPAKTFMVPAYTEGERAAFLARFAQLRVYPHVARGTYRFAHFTSKAFGREKAYLGACLVKDVGAWSRFVRTARLWDRGAETTLTIRAVTPVGVGRFHAAAYDEVVLAPKPTAAIHLNAPPHAKAFLVDDFGVRQRIIRIPRDASYDFRLERETYTTAWPNAELIDIRPEAIAEAHPGQPTSLYSTRHQFIAGKCLPPTIAWRFLYERWHIHDPDRLPEERKRATHLGFTRLGMPPYHAEIRIRITGRQAPRIAGLFVNGHLVAGNRKPIADVREAIRVSKALRDRILIDTRTWRFPRAGDRLSVGGTTLGHYIEV